MNREDAAAYLATRYANYLDTAQRQATDTPEGIGPVLDDALRAAGVAEDELATGAPRDPEGFRLHAEHRLLRQLLRDFGPTMFNVSLGGDAFALLAVRQSCERDLALIQADLTRWYDPVHGPGTALLGGDGEVGGGLVTLNLNFLATGGA